MLWCIRRSYFKLFRILNQKATHQLSAQISDDDYYKRIEAIQFTMNHDGNNTENIKESDIVLIELAEQVKHYFNLFSQ